MRKVLIVLALAGTIFNAWTTFERRMAMPADDPFCGFTGRPPCNQHLTEIRFLWDHAAKVEFGILVAGVCVWLLIPLAATRLKAP